MSKQLTKEEILSAKDMKIEKISVPEWGGHVHVKNLTGSERDAYESSIVQQTKSGATRVKLENARARLLVMTVCDETGKTIFTMEDIFTLGAKNAAVMQRCFDKAMELSGLKPEDVEELLGNSEADQSESST